MRTHTYADTIYEIFALAADGFGVKSSIEDSSPATVSRLGRQAAAEAWTVLRKCGIQAKPRPD